MFSFKVESLFDVFLKVERLFDVSFIQVEDDLPILPNALTCNTKRMPVVKLLEFPSSSKYRKYRVSQKKRTFRIIILQADTSERSPGAAWSLQARLVGLDGL